MAVKIIALPKGHTLKSPLYSYRIESVLGCGGFGITYLATARIKVGNVLLTGKFAIKEHFVSSDCERELDSSRVVYSNPAKERVENSRKDFIAEAKRLHKVGVDHPNIVKVNEVFETNNTAYYVMEYLDGESLRSFVKSKGMLEDVEMLSIMNPIIEAVQYLHKNRLTHLDIKPDNIMLAQDENGGVRPVLIDFGLSKHYDKNGKPTSTINTLGCSDGYAPIEQYAGITSFSPSADIYALGATMWFCLTGKDPKKSTDLDEDELACSNINASNEVIQLIKGACSLNRNRRVIYTIITGSLGHSRPESSGLDVERGQPLTQPIDIGNEDIADYNLFKLNSSINKTIYLCAVIPIFYETIFTYSGYRDWYNEGLSGIFKQISTIITYILSLYGLLHTRAFVKSNKLKYIWSSIFVLSLLGLSGPFFKLTWIFDFFCIYALVIGCYEFVVTKFPKYTQIVFILFIVHCIWFYGYGFF